MEALSYVKFGDKDGLGEFLFENGMQHQLFYDILGDNGIVVQKYPLTEADPDNLDDWLFVHTKSIRGWLVFWDWITLFSCWTVIGM